MSPHQRRKNGIRLAIANPQSPKVRARYGQRAALLRNQTLARASTVVDQQLRLEVKAYAIASALGRGDRAPIEVLREVRIIMRYMRRCHIGDDAWRRLANVVA
jgi:hypothetical protein